MEEATVEDICKAGDEPGKLIETGQIAVETEKLAERLVAQLARSKCRVVLAESCTGGMVASELSKIPGVSECFCGSAVTYRSDSKVRWLGVNPDDLEKFNAVSEQVAIQMAQGVLSRTPEASVAGSITGHFGPGAPEGFDGVVWIGLASGNNSASAKRYQLSSIDRSDRQVEATRLVIQNLFDFLASYPARGLGGR